MSQELDREGVFRGRITEYELIKSKEGAIGLSFSVAIADSSQDGEWQDWLQYDVVATGVFWIVKKDGTANDHAVDPLIQHAGWDGAFSSLTGKTWNPNPISIMVGADNYKDRGGFKIDWINNYDAQPGINTVDADEAKNLDMRFGSSMRAKAGNAARNASTPNGVPEKPTPTPTPTANSTPPQAISTGPPEKEIPF